MSSSSSSLRKKLAGLVIIPVVATVVVAIGLMSGALGLFENRSWDVRMKHIAERFDPDPRIKIIALDQVSLRAQSDQHYQWPWPRTLFVPIIKYLNDAGAAGVAFDVIFSEGSSGQLVYEDFEFGKAIAESSVPFVASVVPVAAKDAGSRRKWVNQFKKRQAASLSAYPASRRLLASLTHVSKVGNVMTPIPQLIASSRAFGTVEGLPDEDGVFRRYNPAVWAHRIPVLPLAFALGIVGTKGNSLPNLADRLDSSGHLNLRFNRRFQSSKTSENSQAYETISYQEIYNGFMDITNGITPAVDPKARFGGKFVLFGFTAPGLMDLRPTPLSNRAAGVELHATALDNFLNGSFIKKIEGPDWRTLLGTLVFAILIVSVVLFVMRADLAWLASFIVLVIAGYLPFWLGVHGFWVPMVWPLLGIVGAGVSALGFQYAIEGRQHRFIRNAFRHYVSSGVLDKITESPEALSLGGERRELTIFFSDIAGFTTLSESIEPTRLVGLLNTYLTAMTRIIMKSGGTVDKYVGDAIVAFWNAPLPLNEHALRGVQAALDCQSTLAKMKTQFEQEYGLAFKTRIGLHTGTVSVGNFGSDERFNYTVIGDAANLASRLEGANKFFGTGILISEVTRLQAGGSIRARKIARIKVVGRNEPVAVYEPLQPDSTITPEELSRFELALSTFESGKLADSLELFMANVKDPVARVYVTRIERDLKREAKGGAVWSPVWNLVEK